MQDDKNTSGHRCIAEYPPIKAIGLDQDGTLGQFWDYFVPAMQYIVPILAAKFKVEKIEVSRELGRIMALKGTHEYPWVLELSKFRKAPYFTGTAAEFRETVVVPYWTAMLEYRLRFLQLFAEVHETLTETYKMGLPAFIVSDAPVHMAVTRAVHLQLTHLVSAVYALETPEPELSELVDPYDIEHGREMVRKCLGTATGQMRVIALPNSWSKPDPRGLLRAASDFKVLPSQVVFIGDNLKKDGGVAEAVGAQYIWARYGTNLPAAYRELIDHKFSPDGQAPTTGHGVSFRPRKNPPMLAQAAGFGELLRHLGPRKHRCCCKPGKLAPSSVPSGTESPGH